MSTVSAGLLLYHFTGNQLQVLLAHPGGPYWKAKDDGAWSIPKGEVNSGEDLSKAAIREVQEETSWFVQGNFIPLQPVRHRSGKIVHAWAVAYEAELESFSSNLFEMPWPPHSGKLKRFPEIDRVAWFTLAAAKKKILKYQYPFLLEFQTIKDGNCVVAGIKIKGQSKNSGQPFNLIPIKGR